jgi:aryl-alcohol dehydrogenase-like predicted oxidoreductase
MGTASVIAPGSWHTLWDRFFAAGGRVFDAAYHYGELSERTLGEWLSSRGVRDELVLVEKGAHTPNCRPDAIAPQLAASLDRLGVEFVDLYLLHRDNEPVPVGEFVDALDEAVRGGRVRAVGVSNWTPERADAFDAYAAANGRALLAALSNQLSLAEMLTPPWDGCRGAFGAPTRAWLRARQLPLLAWSAAARGFFAGRSDRDAEIQRCWLSPPNLARRERAAELSRRRRVAPVAIALAWVLRQTFPTAAVAGPRTADELDACLRALRVRLTAQDGAWLEHGSEPPT